MEFEVGDILLEEKTKTVMQVAEFLNERTYKVRYCLGLSETISDHFLPVTYDGLKKIKYSMKKETEILRRYPYLENIGLRTQRSAFEIISDVHSILPSEFVMPDPNDEYEQEKYEEWLKKTRERISRKFGWTEGRFDFSRGESDRSDDVISLKEPDTVRDQLFIALKNQDIKVLNDSDFADLKEQRRELSDLEFKLLATLIERLGWKL